MRRGYAVVAGLIGAAALLAPSALAAKPGTVPPETVITAAPAAGSLVAGTSASISFAGPTRVSRFECSLDGAAFRACTSPNRASGLSWAPHSFQVRAVDGNVVDPTPAAVAWNQVGWASLATYRPGTVLARAQAGPYTTFRVIVETKSRLLAVGLALYSRSRGELKRSFTSIPAINAELPGWAVLGIAENQRLFGPTTVTEDLPVRLSSFQPSELWPAAIEAQEFWPHEAVTCTLSALTGLPLDPTCTTTAAYYPPKPATIAVIDSGVDATRAEDFGARVVANVAMSSLTPGASGDGYGHGTFVASIAAGSATTLPGVAPTADIVSIRVMDDHGSALTSDVIAAADWVLAHKDEYGIKVANFSLHAARPGSFKFDPLDHAVEHLWFNGVTVVAAAGNFGTGGRLHMAYAPGNDPFVITVGAADIHDTVTTADDDIPAWSAYGYTLDGFAKPELVAPGRYMVGAVPVTAALTTLRGDHVVAPGYMRLSGTSFSAPAVAGAAALLLAHHPDWTPDQVKGALMLTAHPLAIPDTLAAGKGEIDLASASALAAPPNPNAGLDRFVRLDVSAPGGRSFDDVSWSDAAALDVSWNDVSWSDVSWSDVSWLDVSWSDTYFASVSWGDASSADASLADVSWGDVSWGDVAATD